MLTDDRNDSGSVVDSDREKDVERDKEKGGKKSSSKAKDLSHVPCKFFKVGSCTAGSSCPFSHTLVEPGGQKDVCAWYVKGNCKFGHKCALAHVLPGQSMAMDRKNKKAAQLAAGGGGNKDGGKRGQKKEQSTTATSSSAQARNPLLAGSTAPTRTLPGSARPPMTMPLKATISPSVPAPPLKDTDFASFGLPNENNKLPNAPAHVKSSTSTVASEQPPVTIELPSPMKVSPSEGESAKTPPSPLPLSTPSAPRRLAVAHQRSAGSIDYGPIGSPPRSSPSRANGFSPGTSPQQSVGYLSTSPFSAPGTQGVFLPYEKYEKNEGPTMLQARSGLTASLGASRNWNTDFSPTHETKRAELGSSALGNVTVEDEDLEEFLPGSLTDLLTPEERSRRFSRNNSARPIMTGLTSSRNTPSTPDSPRHRFSRSVPAPSLLDNIKSIWSDTKNASTDTGVGGGPGLVITGMQNDGTPTSYKSSSAMDERSFSEDSGISPPPLSPSNASAAFLPGLHHHYLHSKNGAQRSTPGNLRSGVPNMYSGQMAGLGLPGSLSANTFVSRGSNGIVHSPPTFNAFGNRPVFDPSSSDPFSSGPPQRLTPGRPIPSSNPFAAADEDALNVISPSVRALQAHAPGQSLPQGLAAGYSRIHALPPPPSIPSPAGSGAFSPNQAGTYSPDATNHDWSQACASEQSMLQGSGSTSPNSGLDNVFSRLSYSAAATRFPPTSTPSAGNSPTPPGISAPGMMRNASGRSWQGHGVLSPLSGPVVTGDDDDLFSMDG